MSLVISESSFNQFKGIFISLINEKESSTPENIKIKTERSFQTVLSLINIEGNDSFREETTNNLKILCSVKPGRKLIKYLQTAKLVQKEKKIIITKGDECEFSAPKITMAHPYSYEYHSLNQSGALAPTTISKPYIALAHELVHAAHYYSNKIKFDDDISNDSDCIQKMDNLEEQHTIIGLSQKIFLKDKLNKIDFLCENAFHLAFELPIRVDHHHNGDAEYLPPNKYNKNEYIEVYFNWLAQKFDDLLISDEKMDNPQIMKKLIIKNPENFYLISERLKNDVTFLISLLEKNVEIPLTDKELLLNITQEVLESPRSYCDKTKILLQLETINKAIFSDSQFCKLWISLITPSVREYKEILSSLEIKDFITNEMIPQNLFSELVDMRRHIYILKRIIPREIQAEHKESLVEIEKSLRTDVKCLKYMDACVVTYFDNGRINMKPRKLSIKEGSHQ